MKSVHTELVLGGAVIFVVVFSALAEHSARKELGELQIESVDRGYAELVVGENHQDIDFRWIGPTSTEK